jgi:PAS domain S-box-containing protein
MEVYPQICSGLLLRSEVRPNGCQGLRPKPGAGSCRMRTRGNIYRTGLATFLKPEGIFKMTLKVWKKIQHMLRVMPFLAIILLLAGQSATADETAVKTGPRTLRVAMDNNYPPYVFQDGNGRMQGILIDQWRLWEAKTGVRVEIMAMDWGSALSGMRAGKYDVIDTIFKTDERSGWLDFTHPYARIEVPVFFHREISGISDVASLRGFVVAVKEGDAAIELLKRNGVENLVLFKGYEEILLAVKERKVNVFVVDKPPALYFLYKFGIQDLYRESSPLTVGQFHRAVKKGDSRLLQEIEEGFSRISAEELQAIEKRWYGSPIHSLVSFRYIVLGLAVLLLLVLGLLAWNRILKRAVARRTEDLKSSEERYRLLFNSESDAIVVIDVGSLSLVDVNEAVVDLYGYSREELLALRITDLSAEPEETRHQVISHSDMVHIPLRYHRKKDGTDFPVEITGRFFELKGQRLLLAAMRDISERQRAEEALRENRRFLSELIENSGNVIFVKDLAGRYSLVNRRFEEVTGMTRENIIGRTDEELFPAAVAEQFRRHDFEVMDSGRVMESEEYIEDADGLRSFLAIKFPLPNEDGGFSGICGMATEFTERRQAEEERERLREQLAQVHKMESVGRLAGGIAHDFNNMLGVILGHAELAMAKIDPADQLHVNLQEIEKAARRSADLTRQLLAFARRQTVVPKVLNLNDTVSGMLKMLERLIGEDIEVVWQSGENLWPVRIDPSQVDQILVNLCANARDAVANIGRIVISTENIRIRDAFCAGHEGCAAGDYVLLTVTDDGCGMDMEVINLMFEPFYTTKELGKGVGLGLATVYGIVQQNSGFIKVDSKPGKGTTFRIYLPRHGEEAESATGGGGAVVRREPGRETILLVEDEPAILSMGRLMLENFGYHVLTAATPLEALRLASDYGGTIDLLMTDVIMPEMNGWELSRKLQVFHPGLKRLFTSGYTADVIDNQSTSKEEVYFIQKPFTMENLAAKVCEAMGREGLDEQAGDPGIGKEGGPVETSERGE